MERESLLERPTLSAYARARLRRPDGPRLRIDPAKLIDREPTCNEK